MRVFKFAIAALIVIETLVLAMPESRYSAPVFGQVVIGGPSTPVPLTPPPPPGQPQALSTIGAIPQLAPAPGSTNVIAASSYILARQTATGKCAAYKLNSHALSPYIPPPSGNLFGAAAPQPPGGLYAFPPGQVTQQVVQFPNQPLSNN